MSKELTIESFLPILTKSKLEDKKTGLLDKTFVGIDFGTSTTVVSIATFHKDTPAISVKPIELKQELSDGTAFSSYKIPTVIAYLPNRPRPLIGEGAKQLKYKLRYGKNLWHSFKMELGEDVGCKYPNSELGKSHPLVSILNPVDATTLFFKYLKAQIEKYVRENNLPNNLEYAVSIPASFEANQRRDLMEAIESNGILLNKQSFIDEPNAAFLSYVLNTTGEASTISIPEDYYPNILVFDFGAGTCDISILEVGEDNQGIYSKNIAISRFEKLGGDDIDRLIASDILLPQLLQGTGLAADDFLTRELKESIIPKLQPAAERLKIQACEAISLQLEGRSLNEVASSNDFVEIGKAVEIDSKKGRLLLREPKMKFSEFAGLMSIFTKENEILPANRFEKEFEFVSIFNPIKSALKKSNLEKDQIDYLLFIGGSSKNPIVQSAVSDYFSDSETLIPKDLQAHVSTGAATHSLIFNGFGKNVIQPITSEPIMLITKDRYREKIEPIVEAGTVIPSDVTIIDNLSPQRDGQESIELPICVGSKKKVLYNIKIFNPEQEGFKASDTVKLAIEINSDKLLLIKASAAGRNVMVEPLSPFENKEMSTEERIVAKAVRDYNLECQRNGGEPTLEALQNLHRAYSKVGYEFKAAETLEQIEEQFPGRGNLNNIGLHYSNAGKKEKAIRFYEKAMEETPSSTTAFNIAMQYKQIDKEKYREYLEKSQRLNSTHNPSAFSLALELMDEGKKEEADRLLKEAFDRWQNKFETNQMAKSDYSWFASCARALGKHDYATHIEESEPRENLDRIYNSENLTQLKQEKGIQKA